MKRISIAQDFSPTPIGRYPDDSPYCGENFRKKLLAPALRENEEVEIVIDGVEGYGSSFLEEAFGGLVREEGMSESVLRQRLRVIYVKPSFGTYARVIWQYITEAQQRKDHPEQEMAE